MAFTHSEKKQVDWIMHKFFLTEIDLPSMPGTKWISATK
jgi:hypothetical protein